MNANSKKLKEFEWSGYIFANLFVFLEEKKGINLLNSRYDDIANAIVDKRQNSTFILTFDHKQKYLTSLSPDKFTVDELIEFNKGFSEEEDPQLVKAEIEGLKALCEHLDLLTDDNYVILLSVG